MATQVDCYNCSGANMTFECGLPMPGCPLCEKYGDGYGNLNVDYPRQPVTIDGVTYTPPAFKCVWCKDTGEIERRVWDERLEDKNSSDYGEHAMPLRVLPCFKCFPEDSERAYKEAQREIMAKDPHRC